MARQRLDRPVEVAEAIRLDLQRSRVVLQVLVADGDSREVHPGVPEKRRIRLVEEPGEQALEDPLGPIVADGPPYFAPHQRLVGGVAGDEVLHVEPAAEIDAAKQQRLAVGAEELSSGGPDHWSLCCHRHPCPESFVSLREIFCTNLRKPQPDRQGRRTRRGSCGSPVHGSSSRLLSTASRRRAQAGRRGGACGRSAGGDCRMTGRPFWPPSRFESPTQGSSGCDQASAVRLPPHGPAYTCNIRSFASRLRQWLPASSADHDRRLAAIPSSSILLASQRTVSGSSGLLIPGRSVAGDGAFSAQAADG